MDVSSTTYRYNPSFKSHQQQTVQKNINGKSNSLNRVQTNQSSAYNDDGSHSCFCCESDDDSADRIRLKNTKKKIARSCVCNVAICAILVVYTFVGAIVFLAIEGDSDFYSFTTGNRVKHIPSSSTSSSPSSWTTPNTTANTWISRINEESRARAVESIWDITVSLNILYKENWTRLAAQEISRFQEQLVQRLSEELSTNSQSAVMKELHAQGKSRRVDRSGWNLAKAFFYSLTVITTIGKKTFFY